MKRDLVKLTNSEYDLLIIGGGIHGACAAWDASLRGLSVALVDKGDFGAATSSASSKVIHGGIRYLQQGALSRVRESLYERMVFMRIAPHLVHPIPFLIPTYGHFMRGKEILTLGMMVYDLLGFDRNKLKDPEKYIPGHQILSRNEALELEPNLPREGLTGALRYYDCQMHSSERMTLSFIMSAAKAGAQVANYVKVTEFLKNGDRVMGVRVKDVLTREELDIQAKVVANISGPWAYRVLESLHNNRKVCKIGLSKGIHIVTRPLTQNGAVALTTKNKNESFVNRGGRHFFVIPWRQHSLIGTTNVPYEGKPCELKATEKDIEKFIIEINDVYPAAALKREDMAFFFAGFYPIVEKKVKTDVYQGAGKDHIYDHKKLDAVEGLITVIGAKYTTARNLARKSIDLVYKKLRKPSPKSLTEITPVYGGQIESFDEFLSRETEKKPHGLGGEIVRELVLNYGSEYPEVLQYIDENPDWGQTITEKQPIIKAQVLHGVREEMALKLTDIIFRRTGLGTIGNPGKVSLQLCASIMAQELGWDNNRTEQELEEVRDKYALQLDRV